MTLLSEVILVLLCWWVWNSLFLLTRIHLEFLGEQNSELREHVGTCFPGGTSDKKKKTCLPMQETQDADSITALGRSPGGRQGNPLQYSCQECSMDRGAWRAIVHRVTRIQTQQRQLSTLAHNEYYSSYDAICIFFLLNMFHKCGMGEGGVLDLSTWPSLWNNSYSAI